MPSDAKERESVVVATSFQAALPQYSTKIKKAIQ